MGYELLKIDDDWLYLTTLDNPYNPATQSELWQQYDNDYGYNTNNYLARFLFTSDELSESEQKWANNCAVIDAVENDFTGKYIAVTKDTNIKNIEIGNLLNKSD